MRGRPTGALQALQRIKHGAFVSYKASRYPVSLRLEPIHRWLYSLRSYTYDPRDFESLGLGPREDGLVSRSETVPRRIYCFWTGDNPLTPNRQRSLDSLRRLHDPDGIEVVLVTPKNLEGHLVAGHPLHEDYERLHVVHRADYLRAYFLHFHGGGYVDIKEPAASWAPAFGRMDRSDAWLMGDHKPSRYLSPDFPEEDLERLMRRTSPAHIFQCAFIARPLTPLTSEWWARVNDVVDSVAEDLLAHPGVGRRGGDGYPLRWTQLLGQIIDPLTVKYSDKVLHDGSLRLSQRDYF